MLGQVGAVVDDDVPRALLLQLEQVVPIALVRLVRGEGEGEGEGER